MPCQGDGFINENGVLLHNVTGEAWREKIPKTFILGEMVLEDSRLRTLTLLLSIGKYNLVSVSTLRLASLRRSTKTNPENKTVVRGQNIDVKIKQAALSYSRKVFKSDLAVESQCSVD